MIGVEINATLIFNSPLLSTYHQHHLPPPSSLYDQRLLMLANNQWPESA
jgi:hypothetical protein